MMQGNQTKLESGFEKQALWLRAHKPAAAVLAAVLVLLGVLYVNAFFTRGYHLEDGTFLRHEQTADGARFVSRGETVTVVHQSEQVLVTREKGTQIWRFVVQLDTQSPVVRDETTGVTYTVQNGFLRDAQGNLPMFGSSMFEVLNFCAEDALKLAQGETERRGDGTIALLGLLVLAAVVAAVVFREPFFRWELAWSSVKGEEPSEWYLARKRIGQWVLLGMGVILLLIAL